MTKKTQSKLKRLSNPRVRRRLKIGLSVWFGLMLLGGLFKVVYDIGFFNAQSLKSDQDTELKQPANYPVVTLQSAQRIVSGALKEDPSNPQTVVVKIIDDNHRLATVIIENKQTKKIAWIIDMHLFFIGELFNAEGYNLNKGIEYQYINNQGDH